MACVERVAFNHFFHLASAVFGQSVKKFLSRSFLQIWTKIQSVLDASFGGWAHCVLSSHVSCAGSCYHMLLPPIHLLAYFWSWPIFFLYLSVVVPALIKAIKRPLQSPWTEMCYFTSCHQHILCKYRLLGIGTEWLAGLKCLSWFGFDTLQAAGLQGDEVFCNQAL